MPSNAKASALLYRTEMLYLVGLSRELRLGGLINRRGMVVYNRP